MADELFHVVLNPAASTTIVLLHGLTSSHREWQPVAAILARSYHVLIPDLPGHSQSRHIQPFTLTNAAQRVAALIRSHAHASTCHLVGFSAGGYTALTVAEQCPDLLQSVLVSGVYDMGKSHWGPLVGFAPYLHVPITYLQGRLPQSWSDYVVGKIGLKYPPGLQEDLIGNNSFQLVKPGFRTVIEFGGGRPIQVRACVVAGGKQDDVDGTKELARMLGGRAAVVHGAMHWWNLQREELFAAMVEAWVRGEELPPELQTL